MKRRLCYTVFLLGLFLLASSQKTSLPLTADSLATGNYKDVLSSFFQLAFDKFTGNNKELRFTSNPYAVMAKMDTALLIDTTYYRYRHLRNLNFSFAARLDSSYRFNGFSSGVKYALINKRDETVSRAFLNMVADDPKVRELFSLSNSITAYIGTFKNTPAIQDSLGNQYTSFRQGKINFKDLEPSFRKKIKQLAQEQNARYLLHLMEADPQFNMRKTSEQAYDDMKNYFNNRLLWTIGLSDTTYKNQFAFSNLVLTSEVVKGIDSLKSADIELNLKTALQFVDDTLQAKRNLRRNVLSFEPGVNFVLKTRNTLKSFFEFKISGSYYHAFSGLYQGEERDRLLFNGTIRVRIINDIWIPLEIKYDPKTGNVFGFLNVRANFNGLKNVLKTSAN